MRTTQNSTPYFWLIALILMLVFNFLIMWKNWSDYDLSTRLNAQEQLWQKQIQFNTAVQNDLKSLAGTKDDGK